MPRGSKPGERRGGRQKGTPNETVVANAVHIVAAASETAKAPAFSAYIRLFELGNVVASDCRQNTMGKLPGLSNSHLLYVLWEQG
jgi:hypothetical protein